MANGIHGYVLSIGGRFIGTGSLFMPKGTPKVDVVSAVRAEAQATCKGKAVRFTVDTFSGMFPLWPESHDMTCGTCGRTWDSVETPTPSARCPFEDKHPAEPEPSAEGSAEVARSGTAYPYETPLETMAGDSAVMSVDFDYAGVSYIRVRTVDGGTELVLVPTVGDLSNIIQALSVLRADMRRAEARARDAAFQATLTRE